MKNRLNSSSVVPNSFFAIACLLLLTLGASSWAAINSIADEADAGLFVMRLPEPLAVGVIHHHGHVATHKYHVGHAPSARV